jgi:hypothetical protein
LEIRKARHQGHSITINQAWIWQANETPALNHADGLGLAKEEVCKVKG